MRILHKLTLRHLRMNRKRTIMTVVGIVLSVAMVTAVSGMVVSFQDLMYRDSVLKEGVWHVRYSNVPAELVERIVAEPVFSEWELVESEQGTELSLLFRRLHKGIFDESEAVCRTYGIGAEQVRYHNNLLIAKGIVPGAYYRALYTFAGILLALIAVGSVLVISNAFTISADQRSLQFGLLKSVGATRDQIRGMVLFEGIALTAVAIPIGILTGFFVQWVALSIANAILGPMAAVNIEVLFRVVISPATLAVAVAAAILTVLLAAWFPARRAAAVSAVEAIRQTRSIRISPKNVRISPLTGRLFGFEGVLAAKAMRRNRGKYGSTVLALAVSIILFIGVSSFSNILVKATGIMYEDMGSNVTLTMNGGTAQRHQQLLAEIAGWEGAQVYPSRDLEGEIRLDRACLTKEYAQYFGVQAPQLRLFGIGDEAYGELCAKLRIADGEASDSGPLAGILINTTGTYIRQGRRINFVPYSISPGDSFTASVGEEEVELRIAGVTAEIPPGCFMRFSASAVNVIVPDAAIRQLWPADQEDFLWVAALAPDAEAFAQRAETLLEQALPHHTWSVVDYDKMLSSNRNINALVMIFVYGFIAMLTLIGVTSVITTISTSIALRTREFAMLRSVGMTEASLAKMLNYESLLYGVKALLWGIPLGFVVCVLLYRAMTSVMDFPFIWPLQSILISIAAVLLITFSTMAFARRRQRQMDIAETLRDDIV